MAYAYHLRLQEVIEMNDNVPVWEKDFCLEVGGMKWKDFLNAKRYVSKWDKVMQWDDSAGKECFVVAKNRFWAKNGGPACNTPLPDPELHIDSIDWDSKGDPQLLKDLEESRTQGWYDSDSKNPYQLFDEKKLVDNLLNKSTYACIKPTGWDEIFAEPQLPNIVAGMIIGDKESC